MQTPVVSQEALYRSRDEPVAAQDFRTAVLHRAGERGKQLPVAEERRSTEVDQFDAELLVDNDVLVFDVAVYDAEGIEIRERRHQLYTDTADHSAEAGLLTKGKPLYRVCLLTYQCAIMTQHWYYSRTGCVGMGMCCEKMMIG